jgi:ribosomal-protein-alanine N-acetyltransferase
VTAPLRIRRADEADVPVIHAIECASFGDPWSERSFRSMLGIERVRATVAERDGTVVGYCIAWLLGDEAELANLAVAPDARRSGTGAALLDDLLAALDPDGVTVYLEVRDSNASAQALYRSRGFTASGRRKGYYAGPTEDAIVMRRRRMDGR